MIILGIDPGYAIVGWGVLEYKANKFRVLGYGAIIHYLGNSQLPAGQRGAWIAFV